MIDPRILRGAHKSIVVDFDGTLVESAWPDIGDWMPGAIEAMFNLHLLGFHIILNSVRLLPIHYQTGTELSPAFVMIETQKVRAKLEEAGLGFIEIWNRAGKPPAAVYIDDRAERYYGTAKAWDRLVEKIAYRELKKVVTVDSFKLCDDCNGSSCEAARRCIRDKFKNAHEAT